MGLIIVRALLRSLCTKVRFFLADHTLDPKFTVVSGRPENQSDSAPTSWVGALRLSDVRYWHLADMTVASAISGAGRRSESVRLGTLWRPLSGSRSCGNQIPAPATNLVAARRSVENAAGARKDCPLSAAAQLRP